MNESMYHLSTPVGIHRVMKEPYDDRATNNTTGNG